MNPRDTATTLAGEYVRSGAYLADMAPRIAVRSESPREDCAADTLGYLTGQMRPLLDAMGFTCDILPNPRLARLPVLYAERIEDPARPTVLIYGHGDVLWGMAGEWKDDRDPWTVTQADGRIYGRGMADNKGQHSINLAALRIVLQQRGKLGFNVKVLLETGEEMGSAGLADLARANKERFKADCLVASDGPRVGPHTPTVFLGGRGSLNFNLVAHPRDGAHHSGNWGGLLSNPAIRLAHALSTITDATGRILIAEWLPGEMPPAVRSALRKIRLERNPGDPEIDDAWGEPGLTGPEQVYGWCNFEVLAMICGRPEAPVNAVPSYARATGHLRYVPGVNVDRILPALREHLDAHGFADIEISKLREESFRATRADPENPWVQFALRSIERTLGREPALQPNFGGSLPNEVFSDILGMPTIWIPHSYPACAQHAPNEHMLVSVAEEGMRMMAGLFWDLGEPAAPPT
jgi:acetylornithine deacetylase/succinyl-diaminopimelate desuccinylase-like protein